MRSSLGPSLCRPEKWEAGALAGVSTNTLWETTVAKILHNCNYSSNHTWSNASELFSKSIVITRTCSETDYDFSRICRRLCSGLSKILKGLASCDLANVTKRIRN
jgi:hypothetical protein